MSYNNGYQQQGSHHQQGDYQQGGSGLANEYYSQGQQHQGGNGWNQDQAPPQYQQHNSSYGQPGNHGNQGHENREQGYGGHQNYGNQSYGEGPGPNDGQEGERGFMGGLAGGAAGAYGAYKLGGKATGHSKTSGLIGAIGGAFAGSKLQDGVSDWNDDRKEKKEKEKEEEKRREEEEKRRKQAAESNHGHGGHGDRRNSGERRRSGNFAGGFTNSSRDIRLESRGDYVLHAQCRRADGSWSSSSISLDRILENDNGSFRWAGGRSSGGGSQSITVQSGDTLRAIAARHNCTFEELARHNGIQNADMIYPGQRLEMPGGGGHSSGGGNFGASARDVRLKDGGQTLEAELSRHGQWTTSYINLDERIGNRDGCLELV